MSLRAGAPRRRHRRRGRGPSARPRSRGGGARRESRAAAPSRCWRRGRARRRRSSRGRAASPRRPGASSSRGCRTRSPRAIATSSADAHDRRPPGEPAEICRLGERDRVLAHRRPPSCVLGPTDEPGHRVARRRALRPREARRLVGELGRAAPAELAAEPLERGPPPARDRRGSRRGARGRAPAAAEPSRSKPRRGRGMRRTNGSISANAASATSDRRDPEDPLQRRRRRSAGSASPTG